MIYKIGSRTFDFSNNFYIMGILNVTPDSFYDGGKHFKTEDAVSFAMNMVKNGADIIDIGGESSRPGSEPVSLEEEINRVLPVIKKLKTEINIPVSIDTYKSGVAEECAKAGVEIINDISGLTIDPGMVKIASKYNLTVIINHIKGTPKTMQLNPEYDDVLKEIFGFFQERINYSKSNGVNQIVLDPGIGFGKKLQHNLDILNGLEVFGELNYPLLIGVSRKRFIGDILGKEPHDRIFGTAAAVAISVYNGANILRVHDVNEMRQVAKIAHSIGRLKKR